MTAWVLHGDGERSAYWSAYPPRLPVIADIPALTLSAMYGRRPRCKGKESDLREMIRVQPCIRPLNAAAMAAGPDVIR
jgi:hypothetical protein